MGVLAQGCLFLLFVKGHFLIKVLTTPKMAPDDVPNDAAPPDAFTRINASTPVLSNISTCLWISLAFEDFGGVWISEDKKYFGEAFKTKKMPQKGEKVHFLHLPRIMWIILNLGKTEI